MRLKFLFALSAVAFIQFPTFAADPAELTAELNAVRAKHGLPPVTTDSSLCATCQSWSVHLAATGRFYHGGQGEHIIAKGQSSAREVIQDWLNSPGHRAYLLSRNTSVGWGVATGRDGKMVWSGAFGSSSVSTTSTTTTSTATCANGSCGVTARATVTTSAKTRTKVRERGRLFGGRCR